MGRPSCHNQFIAQRRPDLSPWRLCVSLWKVNVRSLSPEASVCRRSGTSLPRYILRDSPRWGQGLQPPGWSKHNNCIPIDQVVLPELRASQDASDTFPVHDVPQRGAASLGGHWAAHRRPAAFWSGLGGHEQRYNLKRKHPLFWNKMSRSKWCVNEARIPNSGKKMQFSYCFCILRDTASQKVSTNNDLWTTWLPWRLFQSQNKKHNESENPF